MNVTYNYIYYLAIGLLIEIAIRDHIYIGVLYILSGIIGGSFGIGLSIIIRVEIALPGFLICSSIQYNSLITFHGILMIFFMIMPLLIGGFGNLLIPLMLCSSDMIFPRLNALSLWLLIDSLFLLFLGMFLDGGVNAGWTFYVPLCILNYSLKLSIESSKGIYSIFLNCFPYFCSLIISNDFLTLNHINKFCRSINLGDLIALLGSIDFVLGSIDY